MLFFSLGSSVARVFVRYDNIAVVLHRKVLVFFLLLCRTGRRRSETSTPLSRPLSN